MDKSIFQSGGVESDLILDSEQDGGRQSFMGSDHLPTWFSLKSNWIDKLKEYEVMQ